MKKLLAMILAVLLLASCAAGTSTTPTPSPTPEPTETPTPVPSVTNNFGTLSDVIEGLENSPDTQGLIGVFDAEPQFEAATAENPRDFYSYTVSDGIFIFFHTDAGADTVTGVQVATTPAALNDEQWQEFISCVFDLIYYFEPTDEFMSVMVKLKLDNFDYQTPAATVATGTEAKFTYALGEITVLMVTPK